MATNGNNTTATTPQQGAGVPLQYLDLPVKAATIIPAGALVVVDATGYAVPASSATGLRAAGRAARRVDNSGGANGTKRIRVDRGAFPANNATAGDAVTQADLLADVYFLDDNTYTRTSTGRSIAGKLVGFDESGRPVVEIR